MASWLVHLIIADKLLDSLSIRNVEKFVVGSISPDCGEPTDFGYNPPTAVTHFVPSGQKRY